MINLKRDIRDIKRFRVIVEVLIRNGFGYYLHRVEANEKLGFGKIKKGRKPSPNEFPAKLKDSFEELGGAFIKLGQLLSLRPDLIPKEYCDQFRELQDEVPPFPYKDVKQVLSSCNLEFKSFSKKPIAAASIGQVHQAVLRDGNRVVVKVQRPKIKEQMESDIDILYFIAGMIEKYFQPKLVRPTSIIREFEQYTEKELDYRHEAKNIEVFFRNFAHRSTRIPKVYYSNKRILVMEFIPGKKLNEVNRKSRKLADNFATAMMQQIFIDGVFHADPHPGNILVVRDDIALIDFGIVGYITDHMRDVLTDFFIAAIDKDLDGMTHSMLKLGALKQDVNLELLSQDMKENFAEFYDISLEQIRMSEILNRVLLVTKKHDIVLPINFVLLAKAVITTESVIQEIDPNYNPIEETKPFVRRLIKSRYSPKAVFNDFKKNYRKIYKFMLNLPDLSQDLRDGMYQADDTLNLLHKDMNNMSTTMDKSSNRIALALIITALIIGSASMINLDQQRIWGLPLFSFVGFSASLILAVFLVISILREKHNI